MPLIGNSVKLKADFKGLVPTSVSVTVYNEDESVLHGPITLDITNVDLDGTYFYWYDIPKGTGKLYYEFCGIVNDRKALNRKVLPRRWVNK